MITPLIFIIAAIGIFFGFTNRHIDVLKTKTAEAVGYEETLGKINELKEKRDSIIEIYREIGEENTTRLEKMLPDNIDTIRLIIDLNALARVHGLVLKGLDINPVSREARGELGPDAARLGQMPFGFSVTTTYETFLTFMRALEQSLQLTDVISISLRSNANNVYDFAVSAQVYYLR